MNISHTQLEACRANPKGWLAAKGGQRGSFGCNSAVKLAIAHFHKCDSQGAAQDKLEGYLSNFADTKRKQWARDTLDNYVLWSTSSSLVVADTMPKLALPIHKDVVLTGELSRVDVITSEGRYRVVLLMPTSIPSWKHEMRWPLIQLGMAERYGRDPSDIEVGIQRFDGANLETLSFSAAAIKKTQESADAVAVVLTSE